MASRPKTGERRRTRQPLKIDKLPIELRDRIQVERAAGATWEEIEELSPTFDEWKKVPGDAQQMFPGLKLPKSSLQRWWDLRVDQVKRDVMAQAERAREFAAAFSQAKFGKLPEAVEGALRDQIFSLMQASDDRSRGKVIAELQKLARLLIQQKRLEILDERTKTEQKRVSIMERDFELRKNKVDAETNKAARKLDKGKPITEDDINRIRERTFGLPPIQRSAAASHPA
jgi:Protein of unknown function (DUF3486)